MFELDRAGHGVGFLAFGDLVLPVPDFLGRAAFFEEQQIGADGGVGAEDGVGQAHDGVQVALFHQVFFQPGLDAFAEQAAVGQDHGGAAVGFEQANDQGQEQVGGFARSEMLREVGLDAVLFLAAERRIGQHDVDPVLLFPRDVGPGQGVVVAQERGFLDAVEQHVGHRQHVRELLFLHRAQAGLHLRLVPGALDGVLAHVADGAGEEAAGAAGRVEQDFAGFGVGHLDHEGGDGARGVVLAGVAGRLQVVEDLLVDVAEVLAFGQVIVESRCR